MSAKELEQKLEKQEIEASSLLQNLVKENEQLNETHLQDISTLGNKQQELENLN
jgi:gamma-glutamyl-gamma-aminobutyrate hydrolase PuuD